MSSRDLIDEFVACASLAAQVLLTLSPYIVIGAVHKRRRNALYIPTETLLLLRVAYTARYFPALLHNSSCLTNAARLLHLTGLIIATSLVVNHNSSVYVEPWNPLAKPQLASDQLPLLRHDDDARDEPQLSHEMIEHQQSLYRVVDLYPDDRYGLKIHPVSLYVPILISLFWALFSFHFLFPPDSRVIPDWSGLFVFFAVMVEGFGIGLQTLRTIAVYHMSVADQNTVDRFRRALTPQERKAGVPNFLWAFNIFVQLGTLARLPQLGVDVSAGWEDGAEDSPVPFMEALSTFMQPFMFVSNVALFWFIVRFSKSKQDVIRVK